MYLHEGRRLHPAPQKQAFQPKSVWSEITRLSRQRPTTSAERVTRLSLQVHVCRRHLLFMLMHRQLRTPPRLDMAGAIKWDQRAATGCTCVACKALWDMFSACARGEACASVHARSLPGIRNRDCRKAWRQLPRPKIISIWVLRSRCR